MCITGSSIGGGATGIQTLTWDISVPGDGLTQCATKPTPNSNIYVLMFSSMFET